MINLLPPEEKEKLFLEKKKKMVSILWLLVLFFVVCLVLILLLNRIYLRTQVKTQEVLLSQIEEKSGKSAIEEFQKRVSFVNSELTKLNSFYQKKIYFSEIIERISKTLSQGTYLNNLSIVFSPAKTIKGGEEKIKSEKKEEANIKVSLSGFSSTRELLFEFKRNLEKEPDFKNVSFPPANWVKAKDIDFFITFGL